MRPSPQPALRIARRRARGAFAELRRSAWAGSRASGPRARQRDRAAPSVTSATLAALAPAIGEVPGDAASAIFEDGTSATIEQSPTLKGGVAKCTFASRDAANLITTNSGAIFVFPASFSAVRALNRLRSLRRCPGLCARAIENRRTKRGA